MKLAPKCAGRVALKFYRFCVRLRNRLFSDLVSGAFHGFGAGSTIQLPATIWGESRILIGSKVHVGPGSWLLSLDEESVDRSPVIRIGDGCSFAAGVTITAVRSVSIGNHVLTGRNVHISDHAHKFDSLERPVIQQGITDAKPVHIGEGSWLGQGVVICPGVTIGKNCVIGANSVVKTDIPDGCVAAGAPAKIIRHIAG